MNDMRSLDVDTPLKIKQISTETNLRLEDIDQGGTRTFMGIQGVKKNGTEIPPDENLVVDIPIPTTVEELSDHGDYALASDIPTDLADLTNESSDPYAKVSDVPTNVSDLTNDSNYQTANDVEIAIETAVSEKQDTLVSGENIKTINNQSLLGSGNIEIDNGVFHAYSSGEHSTSFNDLVAAIDRNKIIIIDDKYVCTDVRYVNNFAVLSIVLEYDDEFFFRQYILLDNNTWSYDDHRLQDELVSGVNIKTINNESIVGSGNISIQGSSDVFFAYSETTPDHTKTTLAELRQAYEDHKVVVLNNNVVVSQFYAGNNYAKLVHILDDDESPVFDVWIVDGTDNWSSGYSVMLQPELVSGTNIKTINNASLLGSGNIPVQDVLVSGTNIKTINNQSLLGSGNIDIQGGGDAFIAVPDETTFDELSAVLGNKTVLVAVDAGYALHLEAVVDYYVYVSAGGSNVISLLCSTMLNESVSELSQSYYEIDDQDNWTSDVMYDQYQQKLVSGTNIKTVGGNSLLGSGDIDVSEVFIATYDQATYADVIEAIDDNKTIIIDFPNNHNQVCVTCSTYNGTGQDAVLYAIYKNGNDATLMTITVTSANSWSIAHTSLQEKLVSGTNIKTINNTSLLGSGNIDIQGGGGDIFTATVGVTPVQDVLDAWDAKKVIVLYVPSADKTYIASYVRGYEYGYGDGGVCAYSFDDDAEAMPICHRFAFVYDSYTGTYSWGSGSPDYFYLAKADDLIGYASKTYVDNADSNLQSQIDGLGEPFRVKQWANSFNVEIPTCTEDLSNTAIPKMVFSIDNVEGADYQIVGMIAYEVFDAATGGNRINCWPVCQFTGNGQKELSVRWMCGGTTRKTAKRINAWVLLKHR